MTSVQADARDPVAAVGRGRSRALRGRASAGHIVMVVAALLAGLLNYGVLRSGDERVLVSVAAADLPPGHVIGVGDVTTTRLAAGDAVIATLLQPQAVEESAGSVTTAALRAGDIIRTNDLTKRSGQGLRAMSLPVDPAHAAGGALQAGDVVDVVTVAEGRTRYALTGIEVLTVHHSGGAGLGGGGSLTLTLAVDDDQALRLAAAMAAADLQVVRATGAPPSAADESPLTSPDSPADQGTAVDGAWVRRVRP